MSTELNDILKHGVRMGVLFYVAQNFLNVFQFQIVTLNRKIVLIISNKSPYFQREFEHGKEAKQRTVTEVYYFLFKCIHYRILSVPKHAANLLLCNVKSQKHSCMDKKN